MTFHNRDHLLNKGYLMTKFEVHATFTSWDNVFTRFSDFDLWWPKMTFGLHGKQNRSSTHQGLSTYPVWSSGNFHLLRYRVYKVFRLWPLVTSNDLWWPQMTFDLHENNRDHLPTKGYQHTKFEVQATFTYWDTVFTRFSDFDLWWPQMTFDLHEKQ